MVEAGPYIECYCEVYVLRSYVIQCVAIGLALVALAHVLLFLCKTKFLQYRRPGSIERNTD